VSPEQEYGLSAEYWVAEQLQQKGYDANIISSYFAHYDIVVNGMLAVEVKISRQKIRYVRHGYYRPVYWFDVARVPKYVDSVVITICDDNDTWYPYVIPSWRLFGKSSLNITSHPTQYSGYVSCYLDKWHIIDLVLHRLAVKNGQLMLPF
jgi:hypothetical protein